MSCCFVIFAHNDLQTNEDVQDMIDNISFYHSDCDFIINHPYLTHPKVEIKHRLGPLDKSSFIFGAFIELLKSISENRIRQFDHFCLVSANQYFINKISFEKETNYIQFLNTENWEMDYTGKDFSTEIKGFPLNQPYGRWDLKNLYLEYNIKQPMSSNWECATLTTKSMLLAKDNIDKCVDFYPNTDMINIFPGYCALMSNEKWEFPKHFGTYDPSNPQPKNWILNIPQVISKMENGYYSVKRVNYSKNCHIKDFVRNNLMK